MSRVFLVGAIALCAACTQEVAAKRDGASTTPAPSSQESALCTPRAATSERPTAWRDLEFADADAWAYGPRVGHTAVWDGREMLVYGGGSPAGASFDPAAGRWSRLPDGPLGARKGHVAAWTGHAMIVVGGVDENESAKRDGAIYDPCASTWRSIAEAPIAWTTGVSAAWSTTTSTLLVLGADAGDFAYSPAKDAWFAMAKAPITTTSAKIAWTGTKLVAVNGGAATYDPASDAWTTIDAPPMSAKTPDVVAVEGSRAYFFGGATASDAPTVDGAIYDEATNAWTTIAPPSADVLDPRIGAIAFVANDTLVVFGGHTFTNDRYIHTANTGAIYAPSTRTWQHLDGEAASYAMREEATVVWTGVDALVLGGSASCVMCNPQPPGGEAYRP